MCNDDIQIYDFFALSAAAAADVVSLKSDQLSIKSCIYIQTRWEKSKGKAVSIYEPPLFQGLPYIINSTIDTGNCGTVNSNGNNQSLIQEIFWLATLCNFILSHDL